MNDAKVIRRQRRAAAVPTAVGLLPLLGLALLSIFVALAGCQPAPGSHGQSIALSTWLATGMSGFIGTIVGALVTIWYARSDHQQTLTVKLIGEYATQIESISHLRHHLKNLNLSNSEGGDAQFVAANPVLEWSEIAARLYIDGRLDLHLVKSARFHVKLQQMRTDILAIKDQLETARGTLGPCGNKELGDVINRWDGIRSRWCKMSIPNC